MMRSTSRARRVALVGAASALALVLTGCGTPTATPTRTPTGTAPAETPPTETSDRGYVFDRIRERSQAASSVAFDRVLADWLPNQRYVIDGKAARPLGQGVVIGDIVEVTPGRAYAADAADESVELAFDSPRALWRTLDVVVAVEQSWGGVAGRHEVRVGLSIDATDDAARMIDGLEEVDSAIVVVSRRGFFRYDDQLLGVAQNGALLGEVAVDGTVTFPGLEAAQDPQGYVRGTETVSALREEAKRAKAPIVVDNGSRR